MSFVVYCGLKLQQNTAVTRNQHYGLVFCCASRVGKEEGFQGSTWLVVLMGAQ
jgi:hypothetical protein